MHALACLETHCWCCISRSLPRIRLSFLSLLLLSQRVCAAGMGKTIQAISLIVAHRSDDPAALPPSRPAATIAHLPKSAQAARPRLRLGGALGRPGSQPAGIDAGEQQRHEHEHGGAGCCESLRPEAAKLAGDIHVLPLLLTFFFYESHMFQQPLCMRLWIRVSSTHLASC